MDNYIKCYNEYISYFKTTFASAPCPTFNEWAQQMNLFSSLNLPEAPREEENQGEEETCLSLNSSSSSKRVIKRESWGKQQTAALVNGWKEHFTDLETFKQGSAWIKIKILVDKFGPEKSVKQIKAKLRGLKDAYKNAKDNNSKTGAAPQYPAFYNDFDEILGHRDIISFKYVKDVGCSEDQQALASPTTGKLLFSLYISYEAPRNMLFF